MLKDLVQEAANNPGVGGVSLGGAPQNRISFLSAFGSGVSCFYAITDGVQTEWGIGTVVAGSPNVLSRVTVLGTSAGGTARLNFLGPVTVYNEVPSQYLPLLNISGFLPAGIIPDALIARLVSTVVVSIPSGVQTLMNWDALGDNGLLPALVVPTSGFTLPVAGRYQVTASITFAAGTGGGLRSVALVVNGAVKQSIQLPPTPLPVTLALTYVDAIQAGHAIQLSIAQNTGAALNAGGNGYDHLTITRIRG